MVHFRNLRCRQPNERAHLPGAVRSGPATCWAARTHSFTAFRLLKDYSLYAREIDPIDAVRSSPIAQEEQIPFIGRYNRIDILIG